MQWRSTPFIAGQYTTTYNSVSVGITQEGFELQIESTNQNVTPSDAYGDSIIDMVYRGGNVHLQFEGLAYKAGAITPFWPWGAIGTMGVIGRLASDVASSTVMTALTGTPAVASPATVTASKSILASNNPARLLFNSKLRTVPIRLILLAYDSGGSVIKWFV